VLVSCHRPRKNSLQYPSDDEDIEEEADEVVPDGVEEVELAKITLEQREREIKLLLDDIRSLTGNGDNGTDHCHSAEKGDCLWMINSGKASLVTTLFLEQWNSSTCRIIQIQCLINIVLLSGGRTEKGFRKPTKV
jgi:hypothetical protein